LLTQKQTRLWPRSLEENNEEKDEKEKDVSHCGITITQIIFICDRYLNQHCLAFFVPVNL
jgi:hypothetical protein